MEAFQSHLDRKDILPLFAALLDDVRKDTVIRADYEKVKSESDKEAVNRAEQKLLEHFSAIHHQICGLPTFSAATRYIILYQQYKEAAMGRFLDYYEKEGKYAPFGTEEWAVQQAKYMKFLYDAHQLKYNRSESAKIYNDALAGFKQEAELFTRLEKNAKERAEKEKIENNRSRLSEVLKLVESGVDLDPEDAQFLIEKLRKEVGLKASD